MKISESKLFENANYWLSQYEKTGNIDSLKNGLIAINDACDQNPWNSQYTDLRLKLEKELSLVSR